jgi:hypothetical protein
MPQICRQKETIMFTNGDTAIGFAIGGAFFLAYAALVITALVQVFRDKSLKEWPRIIWVVGILVFPIIGSLAWFFLGHKTSQVAKTWGTTQ